MLLSIVRLVELFYIIVSAVSMVWFVTARSFEQFIIFGALLVACIYGKRDLVASAKLPVFVALMCVFLAGVFMAAFPGDDYYRRPYGFQLIGIAVAHMILLRLWSILK
jgi:hypothetical protein